MKALFAFTFLLISSMIPAQTAQDHFKEAEALKMNQNYEGAVKSIRKAIALDSTNWEYFEFQGMALYMNEKYPEAFASLEKAMALDPENPVPYLSRALLHEVNGKNDQAIADYSKALSRAKNDSVTSVVLSGRSVAKKQNRDLKGAYSDLKLAYSLDSNSTGMLNNFGLLCGDMQRFDEGVDYFKRILVLGGDSAITYANLGFILQLKGDHKEAIVNLDKAIEMRPSFPYSWNNRGYCKLKTGDLKGALADVNKSLSIVSSNCYAVRNRALIYIAMGKKDKGCEDMNQAIQMGYINLYGNDILQLLHENCD